ncbi:MAG: biotin synthase BioB [Succinivibrio sp.]|nr:biotin synthase BioB [Succinivibrio sp.]
MQIDHITEHILKGGAITREEAWLLLKLPLEELRVSAKRLTEEFFQDKVELCCISNGKCGGCGEDCKFCSQSRHYHTDIAQAPLKSVEEFFAEARHNYERGVHRFSIVTAGEKLSKKEIRQIGEAYRKISGTFKIQCCGSLGLLDKEDLSYLRECGLTRFHNNLETSRRFFPQICTTHTFEQKVETLKVAGACGLELCSGCIIGMGESYEDRIDLAFTLRDLGVVSTPINILNPIAGTPLEHQSPLGEEEIERSIALFRHILPHTVLRTAGGRLLIKNFYTKLFDFGINAEITGDMLTTRGLSIQQDVSDVIASGRIPALIKS